MDLADSTPASSSAKRRKRKARRQAITSITPPKEERTSASLLASLLDYLTPPSDLPPLIRPESWRKFVSALFRSVIIRTPSPLFLAFSDDSDSSIFPDVESYLHHLEKSLNREDAIKLLWRVTMIDKEDGQLDGRYLVEALMNLDRKPDASGEERSVEFLGGLLWSGIIKGQQLSEEYWALYYQFIDCKTCPDTFAQTVEEIRQNRLLAAVGVYPHWAYSPPTEAEQLIRLLDLRRPATNLDKCGKNLKRIPSSQRTTTRQREKDFQEEWQRGWLYWTLPLDSPRTAAFLDLLTSTHANKDFVVLARRSDTLEVTHTPPKAAISIKTCDCPREDCDVGPMIRIAFVRSGAPAKWQTAAWSTTDYFNIEKIMDELASKPVDEFSLKAMMARRLDLKEARAEGDHEILIVDNRPYKLQSDWNSFGIGVGEIVLKVMGGGTVEDIKQRERERLGYVVQPDTKARKMFREWKEEW